jgi:hypothetical protein
MDIMNQWIGALSMALSLSVSANLFLWDFDNYIYINVEWSSTTGGMHGNSDGHAYADCARRHELFGRWIHALPLPIPHPWKCRNVRKLLIPSAIIPLSQFRCPLRF